MLTMLHVICLDIDLAFSFWQSVLILDSSGCFPNVGGKLSSGERRNPPIRSVLRASTCFGRLREKAHGFLERSLPCMEIYSMMQCLATENDFGL